VPALGYLRRLGVAPEPVQPGPATAAEALLEAYRDYLLGERGVQAAVARGYLDLVRPFAERHAADGSAGLHALTAGDVTVFLTAQSRRLAPKTAQRLATALRSLLRCWHLQGLTGGPLDRAVPKVANRRPGLPRPLEPAQVQAMLGSCDRATAAGRRDLAMLTLMARMGLRAGEVAGLRLDDISWWTGQITIRGKGNRRDRLPLPADVGEAVAAWLRDGRPCTALDRAVFTRIKAPHMGLTSGRVTMAVFAAGQRAGLGTVHAHRLRHSAATAMLAGGGSLTEIGQVLRHRRPMTTAIYAKADIAALRALARPWLLYYNVSLTFTRLARRAGLAARPGGSRPRPHDLRDIRSRSPVCWTGAATAAISPRGCRCCRPTSATPARPAPTGTCTPPRNCSPRPPAAWAAASRETPGDRDRRDRAGVLHRAAGRRAAGLRAHRLDPRRRPPQHRRLPRLPRQGQERPDHPADPRHRRSPCAPGSPNAQARPVTRSSAPSAAGR
jgi:integrase/recombinase XerD